MNPTRPCDHCGKPLPAEGRFCAHCGRQSGGASPTASAETTRLGPWERILDRLKLVTAGRYDVQRLLGWGGMAGVYLAEEIRLKRRVAIKVIAPGLLMDPSQIERFEQEARTTAQLDHPNIVTIYEVDEREDLHYFTMTYVPGRSLAQVMSEAAAPLPLGVVEAWVRQVASALSYAHHRGVVHRDIKPGNILLDEQGNALVGDFGIAKVAEEPGLTRTGMLVGTPAYMSPEQCTTGKVSGASDQYSLGAVAYQMIAGVAPFVGSTIQVIQAHVGEDPRDVRELRPDCPASLAEVVMRMLAKSPDDRWTSLYDAVDAVGGATLRHDDPVRRSMAELAAWTHEVRIEAATPEEEARSHVDVGGALQLTAATLDYRGQELPGRRVEWSATPEGVVELDPSGRVRGLAEGKVRVVAASGRVSADWVVSVGEATTEPLTPAAGLESALLNPPTPDETLGTEPEPEVEDAPFEPVGSRSSYTEVMSAAAVSLPGDSGPSPAEPARPSSPPRPPRPAPAPVGGAPAAPTPRRAIPLWMPAGGAVVVIAGLAFALTRGGDEGGGSGDSNPGAPTSEVAAPIPGSEERPVQVATSDSVPDETLIAAADSAPNADAESAQNADSEAAAVPADDPVTTPTPPADPPAQRPAPSTRTPTTAAPRAPATGVIRVLGTVPEGAMIRVRGQGVDRASRERSFDLAPGRYELEIRAPGFETATTELTVTAGANADWRPTLAAEVVAPPAADPPADEPAASDDAPDAAALREAAITSAIQAFGAALQSREPSRLRQAWPTISDGDARPWEQFMTSRDVRDLRVTVTVPSVPGDTGDRLTVPFFLRLQYQNPGAPPPSDPIPYQATVERQGTGWILTGLRAGN